MSKYDPEIVSHGLYATHNQSCAVIHGRPAVLELWSGVFQPSRDAQADGWRTVKADTTLKRIVMRYVFKEAV